MERISISLPENLLEEFDKILREKGYVSRSEGIRDAIRSYILEHRFISQLSGEVAGTISIIYDHDAPGVLERLTDVQHDFSGVIDSSLHIHLDRHHCLEVIVVRGDSDEIKQLLNRLKATKGVKYAKLTTNVAEVPG
ncbi:MAG: nickel-responsive transcriptional regulator NikR [Euryarchaeota archaeon]|nr:nickel-responsive transcriptional regulator NikR [Euryarchaeota archaeon]